MKYVLLLCCILPLFSSAITERVLDRRSGVEIVFVVEYEMFPNSWRQKAVNPQVSPLDSLEIDRSTGIILQALAKYPISLLQKYLKRVYVLKSLTFYGSNFGGTNSNDQVYLTNQGIKKGYTREYVERVFHAELSSILWRQYHHLFNRKQWCKAGHKSIKYASSGVPALQKGQISESYNKTLHEMGFLNEYATSTLENDFNAFAKNIFKADPYFWMVCFKNPRLKKKLRLIVTFYSKLDPQFNMRFFRKISG